MLANTKEVKNLSDDKSLDCTIDVMCTMFEHNRLEEVQAIKVNDPLYSYIDST